MSFWKFQEKFLKIPFNGLFPQRYLASTDVWAWGLQNPRFSRTFTDFEFKNIKSFAAFKSPFRGSGEYRSESDDTVEQLFPELCPQIKGLPMMLKRRKEHNQPQLHKNIQY